MDRYEFLPMGRRRPWVLGAQLGLSLSLLALMLVEHPAEQLGLLMLIGVVINSFAATQDVAVDGMAIDLTPLKEQGRLKAAPSPFAAPRSDRFSTPAKRVGRWLPPKPTTG